ncbi:MAG: methyltransferase [Flavobacteriales bacterium]|jgi:caffeoyl-CoA O-methyltransferase|nr:methyltransferase [Flavobacteriales bacterium]
MEFVADAFFDYAAEHSSPEPELLRKLRRETYQKVLQPRMLSGALQGRLLSLLSRLVTPDRILELGTFTGYATLCLAEGLSESGEIHTLDKNEELQHLQNKYFEASGQQEQIHQHLGEALDILPKLEGLFDFVFIDADKKNTQAYFDACVPKVRPGGLILTDNVFWSGKVLKDTEAGDQETAVLKRFNTAIAKDPRVETVLLPLRDGLTLSRVR